MVYVRKIGTDAYPSWGWATASDKAEVYTSGPKKEEGCVKSRTYQGALTEYK